MDFMFTILGSNSILLDGDGQLLQQATVSRSHNNNLMLIMCNGLVIVRERQWMGWMGANMFDRAHSYGCTYSDICEV